MHIGDNSNVPASLGTLTKPFRILTISNFFASFYLSKKVGTCALWMEAFVKYTNFSFH